jgi:hypothetical protein
MKKQRKNLFGKITKGLSVLPSAVSLLAVTTSIVSAQMGEKDLLIKALTTAVIALLVDEVLMRMAFRAVGIWIKKNQIVPSDEEISSCILELGKKIFQ